MYVCEGAQKRATGIRMRADWSGFEGVSGQIMCGGGSVHKESGGDQMPYIYIYVCIYICMYVCIYISMYVYIYVYIYTYTYMYVQIYIYTYMYIYVYMYIKLHIYAYIYYTYIYPILKAKPEEPWELDFASIIQGFILASSSSRCHRTRARAYLRRGPQRRDAV
jgi:hypothetical protein